MSGGASAGGPWTDRRKRRRLLRGLALRSTATVVSQVALYFLVPLDQAPDAATAVSFALALVLFTALVGRQARAVIRAPYPRLRAIEALFTIVPLLLLLFSVVYVLIEQGRPGSFSESLSRSDAIYFSVTVFATVGFGDIVPLTQAARLVTVVQMLFDVLVLGLSVKVILGAAEAGLRRRPGGGAAAGGRGDGDPGHGDGEPGNGTDTPPGGTAPG